MTILFLASPSTFSGPNKKSQYACEFGGTISLIDRDTIFWLASDHYSATSLAHT